MHGDNAGALHEYVHGQTSQPICFIASDDALISSLRARGFDVLRKNTIQARLAILKAPLLLYTHGEDDLDTFLILFRSALGLRIHLNHSQNHIKAGQHHRKDVERFGYLRRLVFDWLITDFDYLLASSPLEKKHFDLSFPQRTDDILNHGGGAHVDRMFSLAKRPPERLLLWFPTFRDSSTEKQQLVQVIDAVARDARLSNWLSENSYKLVIARHINSTTSSRTDELDDVISFCSPSEVVSMMSRAACFISDYSGLLVDWLIFDRPTVYFPFDIDSFLETRRIYIPYDELCVGHRADTVDALVEILTTLKWQDMEAWSEQRARLKGDIFPFDRPVYSKMCFETIRELGNGCVPAGPRKERAPQARQGRDRSGEGFGLPRMIRD